MAIASSKQRASELTRLRQWVLQRAATKLLTAIGLLLRRRQAQATAKRPALRRRRSRRWRPAAWLPRLACGAGFAVAADTFFLAAGFFTGLGGGGAGASSTTTGLGSSFVSAAAHRDRISRFSWIRQVAVECESHRQRRFVGSASAQGVRHVCPFDVFASAPGGVDSKRTVSRMRRRLERVEASSNPALMNKPRGSVPRTTIAMTRYILRYSSHAVVRSHRPLI